MHEGLYYGDFTLYSVTGGTLHLVHRGQFFYVVSLVGVIHFRVSLLLTM